MSAPLQWSDVSGVAHVEQSWTLLRQGAIPAGENTHQGRALTLNLVVRVADAPDDADAARMAQYLWRIGPRHPARVFLVSIAHQASLRLQAAAQEQGSELLHVHVSPAHAAAFLTPLLQSDLPVLLLWRGGLPAQHPEFQTLAALADRVLLDAQYLGIGADAVASLAEHLNTHTHLADLSWTRLTPWRQLLYQGLEAEPGALARIQKVTITAPAGVANIHAALLAGWLARQLEWTPAQPVSAQSLQLTRIAGAPVTIEIAPAAGRAGTLLGLQVSGEGFAVELRHHGPHLEMSVRHGSREIGHWAGAALSEQRSEADCLAIELSICGADPLYRGALERACEIARHLQAQS